MDELNESVDFLEVNIKEEVTDGLEGEISELCDVKDLKNICSVKEEYCNAEENAENMCQEYKPECIMGNSGEDKKHQLTEVTRNTSGNVVLDNLKLELSDNLYKQEDFSISHQSHRIQEGNIFMNSGNENILTTGVSDVISSPSSTTEKYLWHESSEYITPDNSLENHFDRGIYERVFSCQECNSKFSNKNDVYEHLKFVHGLTYICNECDKQFLRKAHLYGHMLLHLKIKKHKCGKCGQCFTYKSGYDRHNIKHHGGNEYVCTKCNKRFMSKKCFDMHLLMPDCEKRVKMRSKQLCTVRYDALKKVLCEICEKLVDSSHYKRHLMIHKGIKNFACAECEKHFTTKCNLEKHLKRHFGTKNYVCVECNKSFFEKGNYTRHMLMHTGGNRYRCSECNKVYKDKYTFKIHCMRHRGIEKFKCKVCGECFAGGKTLKKHMLTKHSSFNDVKVLSVEQAAPS